MLRTGLLLVALGLPTLGLAQSSFAPHAYLGLGVSVLDGSPFEGLAALPYAATVGPTLTAGYQFSPRLAGQLSPALEWQHHTDIYPGRLGASGQLLSTVAFDTRLSRLTVPLLLRVALTTPAARLRLEGLVGAAWLHTALRYTSTETDNGTGAVLQQQQQGYARNSALLTLGPAVRYQLGPRLGLALSLPIHYELRSYDGDYYVPNFRNHLLLQPQLSTHYLL